MELEAILTRLLMTEGLTFAIWVCLPDILFLLGLVRVRRRVLGGPEEVRAGAGEPVTDEIARQLDALGFVPAGLYREQLPAHKSFREAVFVSRADDCFASVYRLFDNDPARVAFKTSFGDGAFVLTQNYAGGMEADDATLRSGGLHCATTSLVERVALAEVLEEHRRRVCRFVVAGHPPLPAVTMDDYVAAEETYTDHPAVRRALRGNLAVLFPVKLALLAAAPVLCAAIWGIHHAGTWATLLDASLSMLLFRYYGYPLVAALDRIRPTEQTH